jgi:hypothetical protein
MPPSYSAFLGTRRIARGELPEVARAACSAVRRAANEPLLVFDDAEGRQVELDLRGTPAQAAARVLATPAATPAPTGAPTRARGRPQLGVVAREVTLLPSHWEWLTMQPGGASVALRKLVDEARRTGGAQDQVRLAQERTYRFLHAIAGNLPGYEEAVRGLFGRRRAAFDAAAAAWPEDIRAYALELATKAFAP